MIRALRPEEEVAIAVGNQLRLANAAFDRAIRRVHPKTLFEMLMQDLDDLDSFQVDPDYSPPWESATAEQIIENILKFKRQLEGLGRA